MRRGMPVAQQVATRPVPAPDAAAAAAGLIADLHLRSTRARIDVLAALLAAGEALSHHDVEDRLRRRHAVDRVTLYRVLEWLVEQGLAHRVAGVDRVWRFSVSGHGFGSGSEPAHAHAHFRCVECGKVVCLADAGMPSVAVPAGYRQDEVEVTVKGHCDRCSR
jgi:Fur family ferric uptake transcriptional regulator